MLLNNQRSNWSTHHGPGGAAIPVAELTGTAPGPTWLLVAGVHGDEYEGPEAIRRAIATLSGLDFAGSVIALPVANPMAYAVGARLTPHDSGNLNRAFPGDADGALTPRWAEWLWRTFMCRAHRLIDLHAGGVTWQFEPVAGFYRAEDVALASAFGLALWQMPDTPGVLSREFRVERGPAVGVELGYGGIRDEKLVAQAEQAIITAILKHSNDQIPTAAVRSPIYIHQDIFAGADGEWNTNCQCGQSVAAGEVIGSIRDWTGGTLQEITSPRAGRLLAIRRLVSVQSGEMVAVVGYST